MKTACTAILAAAMAATAAMAEGKVVKDIAYADRTECRLDVRFPVGETNFGIPSPLRVCRDANRRGHPCITPVNGAFNGVERPR